MTQAFFMGQVERLKNRFGPKAFDQEFTRLIAAELKFLNDEGFLKIVNFMIGSRPTTRPPLLQDFRDAKVLEDKKRFENEVNQAAKVFEHPAAQGGLKKYLAKEFPGCKSLKEAIEVRRLQIQIAKANDPNYDPMLDQKWR